METSPILIVSATEAECEPILQQMARRKTVFTWLHSGTVKGKAIEILVSGIGCVATAFRLAQTMILRRYSYAISIGIAGSFAEDIPICQCVQITEDCFADLGIDHNGQFRNLREEGLSCDNFDSDFIINPSPVFSHHRQVRGVTVQTASGSKTRINELTRRFHPHVETMENAAFFYVCRQMQVPFASFRAISNKVEPRNRENWQIAQAINNVNDEISNFLFRPVTGT